MRIEVLVDMHGFVWNNTEIPCTPYPFSPTGDIWQNSSKYHNLDIGNDYNWLMLFSVLIYLCLFVCVCCFYECENWELDLPQFTQALTPRVQSTQSLACHHWQIFSTLRTIRGLVTVLDNELSWWHCPCFTFPWGVVWVAALPSMGVPTALLHILASEGGGRALMA